MAMAALLAAVPFLTGCVLLEPTNPYGPTNAYAPPAVASEAAEAPAADLPEGPLTLEKIVAVALSNNPTVAARRWDTEAADAARDVARAEAFPHVSAVAGYTHSEDPMSISPPGPPFVVTRNVMSAGLVVRMPVFTGGRIVSRIQAAELLEKAATHRLARTREELVFNVTSVYCRILAQRHVIESIRFSRQTLREHLDRVEALVAQEQAAPVDRLRTEVRLADVEEQLVRA
ncbi:MAG: TolC family protein, partial [Phycisphaerae bacterium]